ncbi:xanthine/uracil/vitamin C permease-like protein [Dunaliella salina]|uniref:Xanthine/uracil/vitamin C permease-like protein n=1 Tax=Dunaliella salina TaxID=3046 RepID=A0ABQ7GAN7_DUNSA|nr:xanthine/uracil/vitamin C permease-like protein [Dunaliella salina]|eukprot:KAF5831672.1 xanthine/uracil/vitamin C permease-like protein [Dunaliella salina]
MSDPMQSNDVERGSGGGLGSKIANMFNPSASLPSADTNKVEAMASESVLSKYEDSKGPMGAWARWHLNLNKKLTAGWIGRYFECDKRGATFFSELRAGLICFLTVAYIIPVNSGILADTGGSCEPSEECTPGGFESAGEGCKFFDPGYLACVADVRKQLISSTCIAAMISTFIMSLCARMPMALAPAMGINAYFAYTVVGFRGTGLIGYKQALAAVFIEGIIFLFLSICGLRVKFLELIPKHILYSTTVGIGMFLSFIGLQYENGVGLVSGDTATLVTLGGCPKENQHPLYAIHPDDATFDTICGGGPDAPLGLPPGGPNYQCVGGELKSGTLWLGFMSGIMMTVLMMKGVHGSILFGLLFCTFVSWIPGHAASFFTAPGFDGESPLGTRVGLDGRQRYDFFRKGADLPYTSRTGGVLEFSALSRGEVWAALITFLYLDFLDATATSFALAQLVAKQVGPGFMNAFGHWPRQTMTLATDGIATIIGSLLGTSPLTIFAESAVGIRAGGRTGITSFVVAFGFFCSMFLAPIFGSIPPYATGPAIIMVGALMMERVRFVEWDEPRQAVPAFLTILTMPLTYSIAYGLVIGLLSTGLIWFCDILWESTRVLCGQGEGKTMRHVMLDAWSNWIVAFGYESVLIRDLPGYVPCDHSMMDPSASMNDASVKKLNAAIESAQQQEDRSNRPEPADR